jgi:hypothetical protein
MNIRSPTTGIRVKAAKVLYRRVQRIRHVVRVNMIPVATEDVCIDRPCDHRTIHVLHRPDDRSWGKPRSCSSEKYAADHIVAITLLKPANSIAAAR